MDSPLIANVRDLPWLTSTAMGDACVFEDDDHRFAQLGYNLAVLQPGQRGAQYHRELDNQEDFLVLAGECLAIVEVSQRAAEAVRKGASTAQRFPRCPDVARCRPQVLFLGTSWKRSRESESDPGRHMCAS
jgi:hypothetical protein